MNYLILVLVAVGSFAAAAHAAPKPVRTYESCSQLADQRGFLANDPKGGRKRFMKGCMRGRIQ